MSREPFVTPVTPTFVDDSVAPPGKHIVNLFGGHAPYTLKTGDWATRKDELVRNVLQRRRPLCAGLFERDHRHAGADAARHRGEIGSPHGHIFHGELQVDQLFWARPAPHWATTGRRSRASINAAPPLIRAAASAASPGYNAAREILRTGGGEARL